MKTKTIYQCGDRFRVYTGEDRILGEYILAQVHANISCLINLKTGNRLKQPIRIGDSDAVTAEELDEMVRSTGEAEYHYEIIISKSNGE